MKKKRNWNLILGSIITALMLLLIVVGFFWTPYDPDAMNGAAKMAGVSLQHPLGCDQFGRDALSRVMKGCGTTLYVAVGTIAISVVCGILLGAFTGYYGGVLDEILMRINDTIFAFPSILLALVFISLFGPGTRQSILALGIAFIPSFSRIVRSEFLRYRGSDYVRSAKLAGASDLRIIFVHILPNTRQVLLSSILIGFNNAVLAESSMSYLGIGVQPPQASLGRMLSEAQTYLLSKPSMALFPGLALVLLVLGFALLGEGISGGKGRHAA